MLDENIADAMDLSLGVNSLDYRWYSRPASGKHRIDLGGQQALSMRRMSEFWLNDVNLHEFGNDDIPFTLTHWIPMGRTLMPELTWLQHLRVRP